MTANTGLRNPYIAGRALGQEQGFFGREDILRSVETELSMPDQSAVVLFGQRRIGKTSILLQIRRHLGEQNFLPVYFDLMDRARRPLGEVLYEIATTLASEVGMLLPSSDVFDDQGVYFRQSFLPNLYRTLKDECRPVLLLDEFDVLDIATEEQLSSTIAARAFFPYLRQLMHSEPRLGFVFVVGRRAEDLSIDVKATFKSTRFQRVSVLDEPNAIELIKTAERQGSLMFTESAIQRIMELTSGHPYLTQLLCQILWNDVHSQTLHTLPMVDIMQVEAATPKVLQAGQNIFEWIWDGLPSAERVIFAAIAGATDEHSIVTKEQILDVLQSQGIRLLTRELELAPDTLVQWEMLREVRGGYRLFVELLRRWVASYKPLPRVKDELDRVVPLADTLYRSAEAFYRQADNESANDQLVKALRANPNHFKARLLLGQVLLEQGNMRKAISELEKAYRYDEDQARYPLIRTLLLAGEELERQAEYHAAMSIYNRVLDISPREQIATERRLELKRAIAEQLQQDIPKAQKHELHQEWAEALAIYERLARLEPDDPRWQSRLERVRREHEILDQYARGHRAYSESDWASAAGHFANVIWLREAYQDATVLLQESGKHLPIKFLYDFPYISPIICLISGVGAWWLYVQPTEGSRLLTILLWIGVVITVIVALCSGIWFAWRMSEEMPRSNQWQKLLTSNDYSGLIEHFDDRLISKLPGEIDQSIAYYNRGLTYLLIGERDLAIANIQKALELYLKRYPEETDRAETVVAPINTGLSQDYDYQDYYGIRKRSTKLLQALHTSTY